MSVILIMIFIFFKGILASAVVPLPREMSFPLEKHDIWHMKFDHIQFPNCTGHKLYKYLKKVEFLFHS